MFLTQLGDKVCLDLEDLKQVLLPERLNRVVIDDVLGKLNKGVYGLLYKETWYVSKFNSTYLLQVQE